MVKSEKGQALMEFALILPILLLLVSGIFDFGRITYTYMNLNLTTQEAVRLGGLGENDAGISQYVENHFTAGDPAALELTITPQEAQRKSGEYITVTLNYPVEYVTPFLSFILPSPFMVSTNSTMRIE